MASEAILADDLHRAFAEAAKSVGAIVERHLRLAGRTVRFRFAGHALKEKFMPSMAPFRAEADEHPALTIHFADTGSTGVRRPRLPWPIEAFDARGVPQVAMDPAVSVALRPISGALAVFDARTKCAFYWVASAEIIPPWEVAAPVRAILAWWAAREGFQLAHAAAIGAGHGGVLLSAQGGSGKSTTAISALLAGFRFVGDDYVLLSEQGGRRFAHCLYATAKLFPDSPMAGEFPDSMEAGIDEKATIHLNGRFKDQLTESLPINAIVVPHVNPHGPILKPLSPPAVLRALAPTTLLQLPGSGATTLRFLAGWAQQLPGYSLGLGPDLQANLDTIRTLLPS